ncbi:MAG TPA: CPBP family intramembrane glutamate endopeptidase, partial [Nocardioides sp.]|nr:CPBP family intramembrane glutamate endopeptidase [Nocardioides sp.]
MEARPDTQPLPYHLLHRGGRPGRWRPIVGVLSLGVAFLVVIPVIVQVPFAVGFALAGRDVVDSIERLLDLDDPTPLGLAYLNVVLALAIPAAWLITRALHGLRPGWLASVRPRLRWGWFAVCFGLSVAALIATLVVSVFVPAQGEGTEVSGQLNDFTSTTRDFLLVVLFLTPLQAAGEEYAFRGYLTQAFG